MSKKPFNDTVTGIGTLPAGIDLVGTTFDTDPALATKINVTGVQVKYKSLYEGDSFFSEDEMRKVKGFYPDGSILIDAAFSSPLVAKAGKRVKNGSLTSVSLLNNDAGVTGTVDGKPVLPKKGVEHKASNYRAGLDAIIYDTNGGVGFLVATTT